MFNMKAFWTVLVTLICINLIRPCLTNAILDLFDWSKTSPSKDSLLLSDQDNGKNYAHQSEDKYYDDGTLISVPFEEIGPEDKFLLEAEKINTITLTGLDKCEHKVIANLRGSCSELTEEELAKLTIKLLNCQSEISGRKQVICTETMSLRECISPMDSETWNAYHIINNRARVVCYSLRQQQFRSLSELAVNKLMSSTLNHMTSMNNLKEVQKELTLLTTDTVSTLTAGHRELMEQVEGVRGAQAVVHHNIASNIKDLAIEKSLIHRTKEQLTSLMDQLFKQLETQGSQMESFKDQEHLVFDKVLTNLADIATNIDTIWADIEKKNQHLLQQQEILKQTSSETLQILKHINEIVLYLFDLIDQAKILVDQKIIWAKDFVGGDGAVLISLLLHVIYLLTGVLVTLFLQLSLEYRLSLLGTVVTNATLLYYNHQYHLDFVYLSAYVACVWAFILCWTVARIPERTLNPPKNRAHEENEKIQMRNTEQEDESNLFTSYRSENSAKTNSIPNGIDSSLEHGYNQSSSPQLRRSVSPSISELLMRQSHSQSLSKRGQTMTNSRERSGISHTRRPMFSRRMLSRSPQ